MRDTLPERVRLGEFEADLRAGEIQSPAGSVRLQEKSLRVLQILIEHQGGLVTREEIQRRLWPNDTIVDFENGINTAIRRLRQAFGDSADEPRYIETIPRRGYRLLVLVERVEQWPVASGPLSEQGAGAPPSSPAFGERVGIALTGRTVSHYRVLDIIGGGGMGVVYRAEDLKLGRQVALKFLPEELGSDSLALERFGREARAASSLDHPNICHIYEFGEHEGRPFIVMQLMEGQTLRDRLAKDERALPLAELLDIGIQVCDGLQAAHEKGIIHRDIKPANIFLTRKGTVKILDFGLAKLVEAPGVEAPETGVERGFSPASAAPLPLSSRARRSSAAADDRRVEGPAVGGPFGKADPSTACPPGREDAAGEEGGHSARDDNSNAVASAAEAAPVTPADATLTRTGVAMGTAGYMSPEQVRGEKLDARTDVFSFGLVLYEMATGQRPFTGETAAVVHDAILNNSPVLVRELNSATPAKLVTVIDKALEKDRNRRYQSAAELGVELERLRGEIDVRKNRRRWPLWVAAAALMFVALGWLVRSRTTAPPQAHEQQITANPLENPVTGAAISPDGKYIAYHDQIGVYLRAIDSGETRPVALPADFRSRVFSLCWSPTGGKLLAEVGSSDGWDIWIIPLQGDTKPRLLYRNAAEPSVSPDGQRVAFVSYGFGTSEKEIWIGDMEGQSPRSLVASENEQLLFAPAWSPDGRWLAYGRHWKTEQGAWSSAIETRPAEGGPKKTLLAETSLPDSNTFQLRGGSMFTQTWLPDWRLVFRVGQGPYGDVVRSKNSLWQLRVSANTAEATAAPQPLTQWWTGYGVLSVSAAADGKRLAVLRLRGWGDVYVALLGGNGTSMKPPQRLTLDQRGSNLNSWTLDNQILLDSARNGKREIFQQGPNDTVAETMVSGALDAYSSTMSPTGGWLLYLEGDPPEWTLVRRPAHGGNTEKVVDLSHQELNNFVCSRNPKASSPCVLGLMEGEKLALYSLDPVRGRGRLLGRIEVVGRYMGWDFSPDGSKVALVDQDKYGPKIEVLDLADKAWHEIALEPSLGHLHSIGWAADGRGFFVTSVTDSGHKLLHVSMTGRANTLWQVGRQGSSTNSPLASPDGNYIAYNGETWDSNVWMIDKF